MMRDHIAPEMISLAREAMGLTQKELAEWLGYSIAKMSKIEHGLFKFPSCDLDRLSSFLGQSPEFFGMRPPQKRHNSDAFHRRALKTAPSKKIKKVDRAIDILQIRTECLLSGVSLNVFEGFDPIDIDGSGVTPEEIALNIRRRWGMASGPILDLIGTAERCGAIVFLLPFENPKDCGRSFHNPPHPPMIVINGDMPADRIRWTVAHEIGHLIMHPFGSIDGENEADRFAGEFLMPADDIRPEFSDRVTLESLFPLKHRWRASIQSLVNRAASLGAITASKRSSLYKQISYRGWRKREPFSFEAERPGIVKEIIRYRRENHEMTISDLAFACKATVPSFVKMFLPGEDKFRILSK